MPSRRRRSLWGRLVPPARGWPYVNCGQERLRSQSSRGRAGSGWAQGVPVRCRRSGGGTTGAACTRGPVRLTRPGAQGRFGSGPYAGDRVRRQQLGRRATTHRCRGHPHRIRPPNCTAAASAAGGRPTGGRCRRGAGCPCGAVLMHQRTASLMLTADRSVRGPSQGVAGRGQVRLKVCRRAAGEAAAVQEGARGFLAASTPAPARSPPRPGARIRRWLRSGPASGGRWRFRSGRGLRRGSRGRPQGRAGGGR